MQAKVWICPTSGGAEHLRLVEETLPALGPNDVLVRHRAIGINFMDVYFRSGLYSNPTGRLGAEAAGIVEDCGAAVADIRVGDHVAYATGPNGAYSDVRIVDAAHLVRIPKGVGFSDAAGSLLKGMTAGMLVTQVLQVGQTDRVLVHAAAGGVGLLMGQWLRTIGAQSIGVVGGARKREQARQNGYLHVIDHEVDDVVQKVLDISDGNGVDIVFDGVGKDTFDTSLSSLKLRGTLVSFGAASGAVPPFSISRLAPKALYVTRPTLTAYTRTRPELVAMASEVLERVRRCDLRVSINTYGFDQIPTAHLALERRQTVGSIVIEL